MPAPANAELVAVVRAITRGAVTPDPALLDRSLRAVRVGEARTTLGSRAAR